MNYELLIEKQTFEKIMKVKETGVYLFTGRSVVNATPDMEDEIFLITHGDKEGGVLWANDIMPLEDVLKDMLERFPGIKRHSYKAVCVICCYGAMQQEAERDGVRIYCGIRSAYELTTFCWWTMGEEGSIVISTKGDEVEQ